MTRAPSLIGFICESCERPASVKQIRRWNALCKRCQGDVWTLFVNYTDMELERSNMGLFSMLTFGIGWDNVNTYTNQVTADGLSAEVVQALTGDKEQMAARCVQFIRDREQQGLRDLGARHCRNCDMLYMPVSDKPWTNQGYCSKSCAHQDGVQAVPVASAAPTIKPVVSNTKPMKAAKVTVKCPNGHPFEVPISFSGCQRPCATCGAKTQIP